LRRQIRNSKSETITECSRNECSKRELQVLIISTFW
jgi:hypothetical protein